MPAVPTISALEARHMQTPVLIGPCWPPQEIIWALKLVPTNVVTPGRRSAMVMMIIRIVVPPRGRAPRHGQVEGVDPQASGQDVHSVRHL